MNKRIKNPPKNIQEVHHIFQPSLHGGQSKLKFDTIMSAKPKNKKPTD
jgi:hypothetical protein